MEIKGQCEHCEYAYKGSVDLNKAVICPNCKQETSNWDAIEEVDAQEESKKTVFKESVLQ